MALVSMPVYDVESNNRTWMTRLSLQSLAETVDWSRHRLFVCDNCSWEPSQKLFEEAKSWLPFTLVSIPSNIGTARAANKGWEQRKPGECAAKCDNDVTYHRKDWLDQLEDCLEKDKRLGCAGLKRVDLDQWPDLPWGDPMRSRLRALPHTKGDRWWNIVEITEDLMGTCVLYSSACLDAIGYLYQFGLSYAWDDTLASARVKKAGFECAFLPCIEIAHVDPGGDWFAEHKRKVAGETRGMFDKVRNDFITGARPVYCSPEEP